jgi:predicted small lipoprotein YifL
MRPLKALAGLALVAVLAACGSGGDGPDREPPAAANPASHLRVELRATSNADPEVATLDCAAEPRATGFIEDAEAACRAVQENEQLLLHGPPDNVACTQIFGGPQTADISGSVEGRRVRLGVSREDGCAIAVWDSLETILGSS